MLDQSCLPDGETAAQRRRLSLVRVARRVRRSLLRRTARATRRFRDRLARLRRAAVRVVDQETIAVSRVGGIGWRERPLNGDDPPYTILPTRLTIVLPDAAWLVRLAGAGLLTGKIHELRLRLETSPEWLAVGLQPFQVGRTTKRVLWRRHRDGLEAGSTWLASLPGSARICGHWKRTGWDRRCDGLSSTSPPVQRRPPRSTPGGCACSPTWQPTAFLRLLPVPTPGRSSRSSPASPASVPSGF